MPPLPYVAGALAGAGALVAGVAGVAGARWSLHAGWLIPLGGLELALDPLGGFFLALVGGVALVASVYAVGYGGDARGGGLAYVTFLAAMAVVPLAANALTFLVAWELMSLASYVLVVGDGARRSALRAGWVYAVMTHAGLSCLLVAMLLLGGWTGSLRFADWQAAGPGLTAGARNLAWGLLALGFAGKAGVIPLHVWLPLAHPAAPSHVSALMSGAMIKLGIYGLLRASGDWLGTGPPWWGVVLLLAGAASAVVGVLYALVDRDLKRLLAFSSIENIGIILLGLGASLLFRGSGLDALAVLALAAALYHALNHAAFKALLFMAAGAVVHATGTRDMEAMGGLIKRMPWTAGWFLLGSLAIAALPPLNGFVSEWLTFQALLHSEQIQHPGLNLVFAVGIGALALTAGLALACFVRAFGITFLALPRSGPAAAAHEAPGPMLAAIGAAGGACVALGLGPTLVLPALASVAGGLLGVPAPAVGDLFTLRMPGDFATLSTPGVALALAVGGLLPVALLAALGARRTRRAYETWGCGRMLQTARMEYTGTAFANPFTRVFRFFYRPRKDLDIEFHPDSRFFVRRLAYRNPTRSIFEDWFYVPLLTGLRVAATRARVIQSGSANLYLVYILGALLLLLVLA